MQFTPATIPPSLTLATGQGNSRKIRDGFSEILSQINSYDQLKLSAIINC